MLKLLAAIPRIFIENPLFSLEALLVAVAVFLAIEANNGRSERLRVVRSAFSHLARRRKLAVALVGLCALAGRLALLPVLPVPVPHAHDEFSYLLAADTFASGRLTNPPHPMWVHFETMHVNHQPTYMSMYPPAQGMVLAAGKILFGHPWWGVWLSAGLMCSAICWALQGWLPPVWALLGGLIAVVRLGLFSYWMNSYWGGAVAAIGGALVLGAFPRIVGRQRVFDAVLLGLGLVVLANSRPYEGVLLAAPAGIVLAVRLMKLPVRRSLTVVVPLGLILSIAAGATLYYNWRVTGDPLRLPYQLNRDTYVQARYFIWEPLNPRPMYSHQSMRDFYVSWQLKQARWASTPAGFLQNAIHFAVYFWAFFLGPLLTLPLVAIFRVARDRRVRLLMITAALTAAGLLSNLFFVQHYAAPATVILYVLLIQGLRHLRAWRPRILTSFAVVCALMLLVRLAAEPMRDRLMPSDLATWFHSPKGFTDRAELVQELERTPGTHLVLVRYTAGHDPEKEWVYNSADIDKAKVVWAREMDQAHNRRLAGYFSDRRIWLLEVDLKPPKLSAYSPRQ